MKKRILSLLLAAMMLLALVPATAVSAAEAPAENHGEIYGGTAEPAGPNGDTATPNAPSGASTLDTSIDYCKILGISQATADKFGATVRESLRRYDFDVAISGIKIPVDGTEREKTAFRVLMEHQIYYRYDTFMCDYAAYSWYTDSKGNINRLVFNKDKVNFSFSEYQSLMTSSLMVADHLMEGIKGNKNLTDLEKALLLHDRLAAWTQYDYDNQQADDCPPESYTIAGVLWQQNGVCQGYTEAYGYMLDQCGIENRYAQSSTLNHIWNIVTIDGKEYYVDVTWDDPANYDRFGQVNHDNFMVSLSKLRQNHVAYDYCTIANNTQYDNYFWLDSHTEFQLIGNSDIYYLDNVVDGNATFATLNQWEAGASYERLRFNDTESMKWYWENGGYWTDRNFACLDSWEGKLYVSAAKKIYEYDPAAATWRVIFTPSLSGYDSIYGFTIWGGRFMMNFYDSWPQSNAELNTTKYHYDLKTISGIEVTKQPTKKIYLVGDEYDWRGITLKVKYTDGTSTTVKNWLHSWSGYNTATTGTKTFTIQYYGHSATFTVKVIDPLATPSLTVKNADKGVSVTWKKVANATTYVVYRSYKQSGTWSSWTKYNTTTGTSYTDTSAKDGKVYRYAVYAYCGSIRSKLGASSEIRRLDTPTVKVANAVTGCYVTWNKVTGATSYAVYRCYYKNGAWTDWTKIKETTALKYTDTKAAGNTNYRYAVKALNGSQKSASGTTTTLRRLAAATTTAKKSGSTMKLSWTKVTGAQYYAVYRRVAGTSTWTKLYTTKIHSYTDKTAKKGVYYEYSVRAVNGSSLSAYKACKKVKR